MQPRVVSAHSRFLPSKRCCFFLTRSLMSLCVSISLNDFLSLLFTTAHIHTSCLIQSFSFFTLRSSSHTICLACGYSTVNQPSIFLELLCAYYYNYDLSQLLSHISISQMLGQTCRLNYQLVTYVSVMKVLGG